VTRRKLIPDASDKEIAALAGVRDPFDLTTWRKLYTSRKTAAEQIKYAFEKPPTPAKNGNGDKPGQMTLSDADPASPQRDELSSGQSKIVAAELGKGGEVLLFESAADGKTDLSLRNTGLIAAIDDDWVAYVKSWQPGQRYTFLLDGKPDLLADWQEVFTGLGNVATSVQTIAPIPADVPF
jgi:hypothetical protein